MTILLDQMFTQLLYKNSKLNAYSTHPSTNSAQCCLTAVIGRELVFSTWYGRRHDIIEVCTWYFLINCVKELNDLLYLDIIPFWEFRRETMCVYLNILHVNHLSWTMVLKHPTAPTTSPDFQNSPWAKSAVQTSEISTEPPFLLIKSIIGYINPIPAGGGVNLTPPPVVFFTSLKKHWSEAVEIFWLFLHTQSPPSRPKTGL